MLPHLLNTAWIIANPHSGQFFFCRLQTLMATWRSCFWLFTGISWSSSLHHDDHNATLQYDDAKSLLSRHKSRQEFLAGMRMLAEISLSKGTIPNEALVDLSLAHLFDGRTQLHWTKSLDSAFLYAEKASTRQNVDGDNILGFFLRYGLQGSRWITLTEMASREGSFTALLARGFEELSNGHCDDALRYYRKGAAMVTTTIEKNNFGDYGR